MSTAPQFYRSLQWKDNQNEQEWKDAQRKQQLTQYDAVSKNIQGILSSGIDPASQKPLTPEQRTHLQNVYNSVQDYSKNLFNPRFDPNKGEVPEDPFHKLTTKLHITKPHDSKPAAQQLSDMRSILAQYETPVEVNPMLKDKRQLIEAGMSQEDAEKAMLVKYGILARPSAIHNFKQVSGKLSDGTAVTFQQDSRTGKYHYLDGTEVPADIIGNFKPDATRAAGAPRQGWGKDEKGYYSFLMDKATNQEVPNSRNYGQIPPANIVGTIKVGEHFYQADDGSWIAVPTTTVTRPVTSGGGSVTPKAAPTPAASSGTQTTPGTPGRVIGHGMSADDKLIHRDAIKASDDVRTMTTLLKTQKDYMDGIAKGQPATPRQDLSLIVAAVRAMNPGTVRLPQKELELELKAGSYGDRFARWYNTAVDGVLPDDQRADLYSIVSNETTNAAKFAAKNWQQVFQGKKPLPAHLQEYADKSKTVKIGGSEIPLNDDGTFVYQGHTYKVNPDGKGGTLVK